MQDLSVEISPVHHTSSHGSRASLKGVPAESPSEALASVSFTAASAVFASKEDPDAGLLLSSTGLTANMLLSIIGTTVLGISAQMKRGGWILTPLLLILGCGIITEMTRLVSAAIDQVQVVKKIEVTAFPNFVEHTLGDIARVIGTISSTGALLGMICNGMILEAKNLQFAVAFPGTSDDPDSGQKWWALILSFTTLVYCFIEPGPLLQKSAAVGPVVCMLCVILAWVGAASSIGTLSEFPESCRDTQNLTYWSVGPGDKADTSGFVGIFLESAAVASYGFYCFAVVVTVPTLKKQMARPTDIVAASGAAYTISTALFLTIMLFGYWGFGNLGPDNIIEGMRHSRSDGWWALNRPWEIGAGTVAGQAFAWMVILNLILTDAIYVPCTVKTFEAAAPDFFSGRIQWFALRIFIVLFRLLVATSIRSFIALTSLTSSMFCVNNNILMPIAAYYKTSIDIPPLPVRIAHGLIFVFGALVLVLGSYGAIQNMLHPSAGANVAPGKLLRTGISAACKAAYDAAIKRNSTNGTMAYT